MAFADTSLRPRTFTSDRHEFLSHNRSPANSAALHRVGLSDHAGPFGAAARRLVRGAGAGRRCHLVPTHTEVTTQN